MDREQYIKEIKKWLERNNRKGKLVLCGFSQGQ